MVMLEDALRMDTFCQICCFTSYLPRNTSVILLHKHASIFLRELPLMQEYPHPKYHLRLLYEIKNQRLFYILLTVYFFLMGTLILLYLPG